MTVPIGFYSLPLGEEQIKHKYRTLVQYHTIEVQLLDGDRLVKVYSYSEPPREFHTRLGTSQARIVSTEFTGNNEVSDHYTQISHSNYVSVHNPRGNNTMTNLFTRAVITLIALAMLGFAFVNFGGIPAIAVTPIAGISWFRRGGKESTQNNELPQPYDGVRTNTPREQYIAEQVKQVDRLQAYNEKVSIVTYKAKEQWDEDNPAFSEIQRLITDNNYCDLVEAYERDGLQSPEAIDNTLIAIINNEGTDQGDGVILLDKTFGNFVDNVLDIHCLDCHITETELINKVISIKDQYNVTFKKFDESQLHISDDVIEFTNLDDQYVTGMNDESPSGENQPTFSSQSNDGDNSDDDSYYCDKCQERHYY